MGRFKRRTKVKTKTKSKRQLRNEEIIKAPLYTELFKDVSVSLKKRKQFGDYIYSFLSPKHFLENDENWLQYIRAYNGRRMCLKIGDAMLFTYPRCHSKEFFGSILNRLILLNFTVLRKKDSNYEVRKVLECYAKDQFTKDGRKVYPTELFFSFLFGTIFAIIGMALLILITIKLFSLGFAAFFSAFWTIALGFFWLKLKKNVNII